MFVIKRGLATQIVDNRVVWVDFWFLKDLIYIKMTFKLSIGLALLVVVVMLGCGHAKDVPCEWKSNVGTFYDLKQLTIHGNDASYHIKDGDIPCTPEHEPTYSFLWNVCGEVTESSIPAVCSEEHKKGAAMQYVVRSTDGYKECEVIGNYDGKHDDSYYNLIEANNPTVGVSLRYKDGTRCPSGVLRSATIDVLCHDALEPIVESALEPEKCQYHIVMRSVHGCPKQCAVTDKGLCNNHGYCGWDPKSKSAYCLCNEGYSGDDCTVGGGSSEYDGYSVQVGLLVTLMVVTLCLVGVIGVMIYRIKSYSRSGGMQAGVYNPLGDMLPSAADFEEEDDNSAPGGTELRSFDRFSDNANF
jgi:hypothetical protein